MAEETSRAPAQFSFGPMSPQSFLSVFRSPALLEKTVECCCLSLGGQSSRLVVQLHCKYGGY